MVTPPSAINYFDVMSGEVILEILKFCTAEDLSHISQTCKKLKDLSNVDSLWKELVFKILKTIDMQLQDVPNELHDHKIMWLTLYKNEKSSKAIVRVRAIGEPLILPYQAPTQKEG